MAAYLVLNLLVTILVIVVLVARKYSFVTKTHGAALAGLLVLTLVFDNLIILAGIVGYDVAKVSGLYIHKAPVEDFLYALVAGLIVPYLWKVTKGKV